MKNAETKNTKMMPAICPQCGGLVEVDAQRENSFCPYCGMNFIVEKAINTYNVQHATIEHVNSINIVKTSVVESVLNFVKDQQKRDDEVKKVKMEEEKKEREEAVRRKQLTPKHSPLGRGCFTWFLVLIVCTILIGFPAQALDKLLFNVVSTSGSEGTSGPIFSAAAFIIFLISIIGFAYGWAPNAEIWMPTKQWLRKKFNQNKKTSPSPEEAATSIDQLKNK